MSKKKIVIILVIILVFLILGLYAWGGLFNSTFNVGDAVLNMPNGYYEGTPNYLGAVNITNGHTTVFFEEKDPNIMQHIRDYKKLIHDDRNQTVLISNYTIDGEIFYKSSIENSKCNHCWFVKNNKTYDIYSWDGNVDLDTIVINSYKSL